MSNNKNKKKSVGRVNLLTKKKFVYLCIEFGLSICILIAEFLPALELADLEETYTGLTLATGIVMGLGYEGRVMNLSFFAILAVLLAILGVIVTYYRAFRETKLKRDRKYQVGLIIYALYIALVTILRKVIAEMVGFIDLNTSELAYSSLMWGTYVLFGIAVLFVIIMILEMVVDNEDNRKNSKYRRNYY